MEIRANIFEKLYLLVVSWKDVKRELFQPYNMNESLTGICESEIIFISSFIITELSELEQRGSTLMKRGRCFARKSKDEQHMKRMNILKVLELYDSQIAELEASIRSCEIKYAADIKIIDKKIKGTTEENAEHIRKMYEKRKLSRYKKYYDEVSQKYELVMFYLGEKIRIIEKLIEKLYSMRAKKFWRISFYYEKARKKNHKMPAVFLVEDTFVRVCPFNSLIKCENLLRDANAKNDDCTNKIDNLQKSIDDYETAASEEEV